MCVYVCVCGLLGACLSGDLFASSRPAGPSTNGRKCILDLCTKRGDLTLSPHILLVFCFLVACGLLPFPRHNYRADLIVVMFDAHKLDISDELKMVIDTLKPHHDKMRYVRHE